MDIQWLWENVSSHKSVYLDCIIRCSNGAVVKTNKLFLWSFGSKSIFPQEGKHCHFDTLLYKNLSYDSPPLQVSLDMKRRSRF